MVVQLAIQFFLVGGGGGGGGGEAVMAHNTLGAMEESKMKRTNLFLNLERTWRGRQRSLLGEV